MWFAINFCITALVLLFLPGYFLNIILFRKGQQFDIVESVPFSFASSILLIFITGFTSFIFHLSLAIASLFWLMSVGLIIGICIYQMRRQRLFFFGRYCFVPDRKELFFVIPAAVLLTVILILGYRIEMPFLGQEDKITIMMSCKIKMLSSLRIDYLLFRQGDISAYLIPLYSFVLALFSYVSNLEVAQVYVKIRFIFSLIAMTATYAITKALFPKIKELPWVAILFACASVLSGWGTRFSDAAFAQFFPFSQYYDFAICVIVPLCFLFFIKGYESSNTSMHCIVALLTCSLFFIHAREVVVLLILYLCALASLYISGADKKSLLRGVGVIIAVCFSGFVIQLIQSRILSPDLISWDTDIKKVIIEKIAYILKSPFPRMFYPSLEEGSSFFINFNIFYINPYYIAAAALLPIAFFLRRDTGMLVIAFCIAAPIFITTIPILSMLFLRYTYSQALFGAPAILGMFPFVYILCAVFIWLFLWFLKRQFQERQYRCIVLSLGILFLIPLVIHIPQFVYKVRPSIFYCWFFLGIIMAIPLSLRYGRRSIMTEKGLLHEGNYCVIGLSLAFLLFATIFDTFFVKQAIKMSPVYKNKVANFSAQVKNFWEQYKEAKTTISVVDWQRWYVQSTFKTVPWPVVRFMRSAVFEGKVFAAPADSKDSRFSALYNIPSLTGSYVYTSGSFISLFETNFFDRLFKYHYNMSPYTLMKNDEFRIDYISRRAPHLLGEPRPVQYFGALVMFCDDIMRVYQPIFNNDDSAKTMLELIRDFHIEYIFVTPEWRHRLEPIFSSFNKNFEKIYSLDDYAIYKVIARKTDD